MQTKTGPARIACHAKLCRARNDPLGQGTVLLEGEAATRSRDRRLHFLKTTARRSYPTVLSRPSASNGAARRFQRTGSRAFNRRRLDVLQPAILPFCGSCAFDARYRPNTELKPRQSRVSPPALTAFSSFPAMRCVERHCQNLVASQGC